MFFVALFHRGIFNWGLMNHYFLLTIDVEDWFQVENFKQYIPYDSWSSYELRVEKNTHRILDLFDSIGIENTEYDSQKAASNGQGLSTDLCNASETGKANSGRRQVEVSQFPEETEKEKISGKSSKSCLTTPKATFFVLGWLAERLPHLVREIHSRGHEIASHGYHHNLCNEQSHEDLKKDLCDSKSLLEDIIGTQVFGYRAPSFAINNDILKIIEDCGYLYDSSYNSFSMHGRYGHLDLSRNEKKGIAIKVSKSLNAERRTQNAEPFSTFYELPISNLNVRNPFSYACPVGMKYRTGVKSESHLTGADLAAGSVAGLTGALSLPRETRSMFHWGAISSEQNRGGFVLPWGGGGYFRLIPFPLFKLGVESILKKENAYLFYMHPWEIDADQPRVSDASMFYRFRHYSNLSKTNSKLLKLIENFVHCNFITCRQYLDKI